MLKDCGVKCLLTQANLKRFVNEGIKGVESLEHVIWVNASTQLVSGDALSYEEILQREHTFPADPQLIDIDLCAIIYTSGSTGHPKGVTLTHRNIHNTTISISTYLKNVPEDIVMCVLPLTFDYGLFQALTGACIGFTLVLEKSFAYPIEIMKRLVEVKATGLPGVPTLFSKFLEIVESGEFEFDHRQLRYVTNTAAALPPNHIRRLQKQLPNTTIFSMYGLTECTRVSSLDPSRLHDKITSVGKAIPNSEVYIVDDEGKRVPPGVEGELVVRGANVMSGYWGKPEETAKYIRDGELLGEKVLHTGDVFTQDEEGFIYFVGRKDDMFKSKGEKIYPKEIEHVLHNTPSLAGAVVLGVEEGDDTAIVAFVTCKEGADLDARQIIKFCRANLENYMVPKQIEIMDVLPKTENGKVDKKYLDDFYQSKLKSNRR